MYFFIASAFNAQTFWYNAYISILSNACLDDRFQHLSELDRNFYANAVLVTICLVCIVKTLYLLCEKLIKNGLMAQRDRREATIHR